jgi:DDE superfamily endonuclease
MQQAATMIKEVQNYFQQSVLIVTDSWFGNDGLWSRLDRGNGGFFHMLSRMRTNITLYDFAPTPTGKRKAGRPRKYGKRLGSVDDCATKYKEKAQTYTVFMYGKKKDGAGIFTDRYVTNNEVPGTSCLVIPEDKIRCPHDHRSDTIY